MKQNKITLSRKNKINCEEIVGLSDGETQAFFWGLVETFSSRRKGLYNESN